MNAALAQQLMRSAFPAASLEKSFLDMVATFNQPLNDYIASLSKEFAFTVAELRIGSKAYKFRVDRYPKNNPAEVAIRAFAVARKYPNGTADYLAKLGSRSLDKPETGEPITIAIVLTIIAAVGPIVLPFIVDMVTTFLNDQTAKEEAAKEAEVEQQKVKAAAKAKADDFKIKLIVGVAVSVAVVAVGVVAVRRLK